jgi:hypothetical protein
MPCRYRDTIVRRMMCHGEGDFGLHWCRVEELPGKTADSLVRRELVQLYTPGTLLEETMLVNLSSRRRTCPPLAWKWTDPRHIRTHPAIRS